MKIILTVGLPGSGKTYWAENFEKPSSAIFNLNRDDLRLKHFGKYKLSSAQEKVINLEQEKLFDYILSDIHYKTILISDTNLNPKTQNYWREVTLRYNCEFEIKDFTHVPLETCIKQDLQRERSVGKDVIMNTHIKYIRPGLYKHDNSKENAFVMPAIIFDVDGTLAIRHDRSPYEWDKVGQDLPNLQVIELLRLFMTKYTIIFVSGRMDCCYEQTKLWLYKQLHLNTEKNVISDKAFKSRFMEGELLMRKTDDMRADWIVKREIFMEHIDQQYNVKMVVDDRASVISMWRDLGLTVLQVDDGLF